MSWSRSISVVVLLAGLTRAAAAPSVVHSWDGSVSDREVVAVGIEGVSVETAGRIEVISWSRIRLVEGAAAPESAPYIELARDAWRAGSRLGRGDAFGAEPIFERLFEQTRGERGPTPAMVAEGLLRCRLRRDARASAVEAWLDLHANLGAAPASSPRWGIRSAALDGESLLCPALPPIWFEGPAASAFATGFGSPGDAASGPDAETDEITEAFRVLYTASARRAAGVPIDAGATASAVEAASSRAEGRFLSELVLAQIGGSDARERARAALERERVPGAESWRRIWATIVIGRSLVAESEASLRRRGVLELISVHALDREDAPYLAGVALADAAAACAALDDRAAARSLLNELMSSAPSHPVWGSPALAELSEKLDGRAFAR